MVTEVLVIRSDGTQVLEQQEAPAPQPLPAGPEANSGT